MKKIICMLTILAFSSNLFAGDKVKSPEYDNGYLDGKVAAGEEYKGDGWFGAGLAGGLLLGLIGTGVVVGLSQVGSTEPIGYESGFLSGQPDYRLGFYKGYSKKIKSTRLQKSLIGGVIGTAIIVTILVATQGNK
ncbi:MAG: hypothetical protein JSU85_09570 [Candidatus Zixiibacteriota bacterium]|nr:MAG: hypothetical protein JSU85_09570 [candidate division Zixibacteria bacterium]